MGGRGMMFDSCRKVSVRWRVSHQRKYRRSEGFRKLMVEIVLDSEVLWAGSDLGSMITNIWSHADDYLIELDTFDFGF